MARSRNARGVAREQAILSAAGRLFGLRGFRAVSLREVAAAAGITHPTLLHYFPSKEALLDAVLDAKDTYIEEQLDPSRVQGRVIEAMCDIKAETLNEPGLIALLMKLIAEGTDEDHPAHDRLRQRYELVVGTTKQDLAHLEQPLAAGITTEQAARLLTAVSDGLNLQWLYSPDELDPLELFLLAARLIVGASLPPTA